MTLRRGHGTSATGKLRHREGADIPEQLYQDDRPNARWTGLPSCRNSLPCHRSPWGQPGHPREGTGWAGSSRDPRAQRAWTHVPPGSAGACFEPPTSETPEQSQKDQEKKTEPQSGAKGKEKAREEQEEKAGGCQEPEAGFNPQPGFSETGAGRTTRLLCGAGTRARRRGEACEAPALHRPALVPPYKGDGGPWRGGEDAGARGDALPGLCGATMMVFHGAGFPRGAGLGMREMFTGWGSGSQHPQGRRESGAQEPKQTLPGEQTGAKHWGFALRRRNQTNLEGFAI